MKSKANIVREFTITLTYEETYQLRGLCFNFNDYRASVETREKKLFADEFVYFVKVLEDTADSFIKRYPITELERELERIENV